MVFADDGNNRRAAIVLGILNMYLQNVADLRMIIYSLALILVMSILVRRDFLGTKKLLFLNTFKKIKRRQSVMALLELNI